MRFTTISVIPMLQTSVGLRCGVLDRQNDVRNSGGGNVGELIKIDVSSVVDSVNMSASERRVNSSTDSLTSISQSTLITSSRLFHEH